MGKTAHKEHCSHGERRGVSLTRIGPAVFGTANQVTIDNARPSQTNHAKAGKAPNGSETKVQAGYPVAGKTRPNIFTMRPK